jgi:hypothetical protein
MISAASRQPPLNGSNGYRRGNKEKVMKKYFLTVAALFLAAISASCYSQVSDTTYRPVTDTVIQRTYRIAVFAPVYLDSLFTGSRLRSDKSIPKFSVGGTDFVQGAELALDTLTLNGLHVQAYLYDSKSLTQSVRWLIENHRLDNIDLIIGSVKEPEYSYLAQFGQVHGIPFVSATYPNDGSIRNNPFLFIVNSTLKAHCEGIFSYIMQKHGTDNIYLVKQRNDNRIDNIFKEINFVDGKPLLKIRTIMIDTSISPAGLRYLVDTTGPMVIIGASLNQIFSQKLADACYPIQKTNPMVFIGMPNWDGFASWYRKDAYPDFAIRYTTPHYDAKANALGDYFNSRYFDLYRIKPSDMAIKGFEVTYYFASLLLKYNKGLVQNVNDTTFAAFHNFNFRPVYHIKNSAVPDYYENKHLFIMQILNGEIEREW